MARASALALALFVALVPWGAARAETLQRLTVTSFTLAASNAHPHIEVPFDLVVRLNVRENVSAIDNLNLPLLSDLEVVGDERRYEAGSNGTSYVEVVRVVAHHGGRITVAPATLDALDALDGKPKRYSTNGVTLDISGPLAGSEPADASLTSLMFGLVRFVLVTVAIVVAIVAAIVVLVVRASRRRATVTPPPVPASPLQAAPQPTAAEIVRSAAAQLRADPSRAGAQRARETVRTFVGASVHETLADVLRRPSAQGRLAEVLRALERAAFTYDDDVPRAIDAALQAMEQM